MTKILLNQPSSDHLVKEEHQLNWNGRRRTNFRLKEGECVDFLACSSVYHTHFNFWNDGN